MERSHHFLQRAPAWRGSGMNLTWTPQHHCIPFPHTALELLQIIRYRQTENYDMWTTIPALWEAEMRRLKFPAQFGQQSNWVIWCLKIKTKKKFKWRCSSMGRLWVQAPVWQRKRKTIVLPLNSHRGRDKSFFPKFKMFPEPWKSHSPIRALWVLPERETEASEQWWWVGERVIAWHMKSCTRELQLWLFLWVKAFNPHHRGTFSSSRPGPSPRVPIPSPAAPSQL